MTNTTVPAKNTLHLLSLSPRYWSDTLINLQQLWQPGDMLLLLAEAAQGYRDARLVEFQAISILQSDAALLAAPFEPVATLNIIDYDQWAELSLSFSRTITWR